MSKATLAREKAAVGPAALFFQKYGVWLGFLFALVSTLGSLYYSEIRGFLPCTLCWYQRILMYPLSLFLLIGALKRDEIIPDYVLPFSIIGLGFSTYHYMLQAGVLSQSAACTTISCGTRYVNYLGFITIPLMALTGFVLITGTMLATKWAQEQALADDAA